MARVLFDQTSILDPQVDIDEYLVMKGMLKDLGDNHPEWKGMWWSVRSTISTEHASQIRITVTDPNAREPRTWQYVWLGTTLAIIMMLLMVRS